jgi:glycosyltransferase involved in cell wall biosynthesis
VSDLSQPVVTVVIPALNAAAWIGETLASVIAQSYPHDRLEVVVVDDHSKDETVETADRVLGSSGIRHTVLRSDTTSGPSAARNRGWRHGRGEWIQFLDADDLIEPSKIERQAQFASGAGTANLAVVFSKWSRLYRDGNQWMVESTPVDPEIGEDPVLDLIRADNFMATGSQLFRRTWLETVGGFVESYRFIEDVDLLLRIACASGGMLRAPSADPLFFYRQHSASLARSDMRGFVEGCMRNAAVAERYWDERGVLTPPRAQLLASIYFDGARYMAEHDPREFAAIVARIQRLQPGFVPPRPKQLRWLARICGYPRAEMLAVRFRQLKRASGFSQRASQ